MINVTVANFETEVIEASMQTPVLVDLWAPWCGPCKVIGPLLEKIETDYAGRFKLVKIDSDQEQQLAQAFGIRSIPTCVLLMNGQPGQVSRAPFPYALSKNSSTSTCPRPKKWKPQRKKPRPWTRSQKAMWKARSPSCSRR
jgi:thioredoxin